MKSKTIILSNENEKGRGILTIIQEEDLLQCRIRIYNINKLNKYCKIGIYHENQVYSANLLEKDGVYTSSLVGDFDLDQDFYSAIINTQNNEVVLSGGTYAGFFFNDYEVFNNIEKENPNTEIYNHTENEEMKKNSNTQITNCQENCEKCLNCIYRKQFFEEQKTENTNIEEIPIQIEQTNPQTKDQTTNETESQTKNKVSNMLESITTQFSYVFENYPNDEVLTSLLPNSKFVKIEEKSTTYSIGAIFKDEEIKYICYATFCNYNAPAPKELGEHYQWLPIDKEDPLSEGYYIVFQDAQDLSIVEMI